MIQRVLVSLLLVLTIGSAALAQPVVSTSPRHNSVALQDAQVLHAADADSLEAFVAQDLAQDLRRLGMRASVGPQARSRSSTLQIWVGTIGRHPVIDALANEGKLDLKPVAGCWECFTMALVRQPAPGVAMALVIAGADRRGTAYGVYTLSQTLGVSPWHWWADVAPLKRGPLHLALPTPHTEGPAVRYRGLFINDEDWGLFPWAARTFEPEPATIGPRTYEQVFKLLLRLKANTLWPAMHQVSGAFNARPENAALAQRYGIIMGSSHAEPLLRNNVAEWADKPERYDYAANPAGVREYWAERLRSNGRFENLYTLGMRGIHDSPMQGGSSVAARQALLNQLIADQRELLARHVGRPEALPQIFVPYKEVLTLMQAAPGLQIPDDVTLVWPDDNFGYLRRLPLASEARRSGGSGVYYHLSYLGAPLSYLWLSTTPPALVNEELGRAFDAGAQRLWMVNAGDIKPAELNLSHFFDLAWNPGVVRAMGQRAYLRDLAARLFGPRMAASLAELWDGYYRLNFERRPEHLQYHLAGERAKRSGLAADAVRQRLAAFAALLEKLDALRPRVPVAQRAAFFQLADYPLRASALANERFFALEAYAALREADPAEASRHAARAHLADQRTKALTARYNQGRWAGILAEEPADGLWPNFRLQPAVLPAPALSAAAHRGPDVTVFAVEPRTPVNETVPLQAKASSGWQVVQGLGRGGSVLRAQQAGAILALQARLPRPGTWCLRVHLLPNYPGDGASPWRLTLMLADSAPVPLEIGRAAQDAAWAQGVLANRLSAATPLQASAGAFAAALRSDHAGLLFDGAELTAGACSR